MISEMLGSLPSLWWDQNWGIIYWPGQRNFELPILLKSLTDSWASGLLFQGKLFRKCQDTIRIAWEYLTNWFFLQKMLIWHFFIFFSTSQISASSDNFFFLRPERVNLDPDPDPNLQIILDLARSRSTTLIDSGLQLIPRVSHFQGIKKMEIITNIKIAVHLVQKVYEVQKVYQWDFQCKFRFKIIRIELGIQVF